MSIIWAPAMMEPDVRMQTNEAGFCRAHCEKMLGKKSVLPLALMLQSRLDYIYERLSKSGRYKKRRIFNKKCNDGLVSQIDMLTSSCAVCSKVERQLNNCIHNFAYLIVQDEEFKIKYLASRGLCINHFGKLLSALEDEAASDDIISNIINMQIKNLNRLAGEIDYFTKKFDYRKKDADWNGTQDAPERCCQKLSGAKR